ncbi:hypothetical protein CR513_34797, partial [Mucuna pruriens]
MELGEKLDKVGKGLDSVLRDTQSVNANVKVLSKGKEERPKMASMHEIEESYEGDNLGESNGGRRMQFRRRSESRKTYGGSSGWKEFGSESSIGEVITSSESKILSDGSHYEGYLLVVRRLMNSHVSEEVETQRENIFHSRQAEVMFTLKGYEDRVVFDVVPMEATRLLLGRPWQFDKKVIHDRVINRFTFIHLGQMVVLKHLSPREVHEDQKKMNVKERVRENPK